jgi:hypothetical protein
MKLLLHLASFCWSGKAVARLGSMDRFARIRANTRARVTIQHDSEDFGDAGVPRIP